MEKRVKVRVPATSANIGPGFDTLGVALNLYNEFEVTSDRVGVRVDVTGEGQEHVPLGEENSVYRSMRAFFDSVGQAMPGVHIRIHNEIPVTRGLGSSATAIVAGLVAANILTGAERTTQDLLELAVQLEGHPDNVAPALLGGFVVAGWLNGKLYAQKWPVPPRLQCVVAVPDFQLATSVSRSVLPPTVPFTDAVQNVTSVGLLVSAIASGDLDLFGAAMQDRLHEPYRMELVPGLVEAAERARQAGALSAVLSGSGPAVIAFCTDHNDEISKSMKAAFEQKGIASRILHLSPVNEGATLILIQNC